MPQSNTELIDLLGENYQELTNLECKTKVLEFIANHQSVLDKDILFVKSLTKVAYNIHLSDHSLLDDLLERLLQFNMEGIILIQTGNSEGYDQYRLLSMESHLYAYAAEAAKALFYKTEDISWAKNWHNLRMLSAIKSASFDTRHSAHSYSLAGEGAKAVFYAINKREDVSLKEKVYWVERWYGSRILSAIISEDFDPKHSAHSYGIAADGAEILFYITRNPKWAVKGIKGYEEFIGYYDSNKSLKNPKIDELITRVKDKIADLKKVA